MPLILRVGRVAQALPEGVAGVLQRSHQRRVIRHLDRVQPVGIAGRVEQAVEGVVGGQVVAVRAEHRAHRLGDHFLGVRRPVDEVRDLALEAAIEALGKGVGAGPGRRKAALDDGLGVQADDVDPIDEAGIVLAHRRDHRADHLARLVRRVRRLRHAHQPVERDAGDGVDHRRERRQRDHVAGGLDRLLLGFLLQRLQAIRAGFGVMLRRRLRIAKVSSLRIADSFA